MHACVARARLGLWLVAASAVQPRLPVAHVADRGEEESQGEARDWTAACRSVSFGVGVAGACLLMIQ